MLEEARKARDSIQKEHGDQMGELRAAARELELAQNRLEEARGRETDDALSGRLVKAIDVLGAEVERLRDENIVLERKDPVKIRGNAETVNASLPRETRELEKVREDRATVRRSLDSLGEAGLHEKIEAARATTEAARQERDRLLRKSRAARLLFETLKRHRETARSAYVAPLRGQIETLGKLLFDPTFRVEISQELAVVSRTQGGVTVPYESLSGGTREQLSLLARIACAMLVSEDGGGPLLLDDVLGYSDSERLKGMGAALRVGGERCQIVLLSCVPERYAFVGDADVVRLG